MLTKTMADDSHAHAQTDFSIVESEIVGGGHDLADPGMINRAVLEALARRLPPDYLAERVERLINAKRTFRDKAGNVHTEDDVRANEAGLKLAYAYQVGKPIERAQIVTKNIAVDESVESMEERLRKSPALRRSLAKTLAKLDSDTTTSSVLA